MAIIRFIGAPQKVAFLKNVMNIIDVLAIAPYWISLFFLDENSSVESVSDASSLLGEGGQEVTEEESTFGSVSRIMQVQNDLLMNIPTMIVLRFFELLVL